MREIEGGSKGQWWKPLAVVGIGLALILTVVSSALVMSMGPPPVKAEPPAAAAPEITPADVFVRRPLPSGDNKTALIKIDIEMSNIGEGQSGTLLVWGGAFDHVQPNLLLSDFSTSSLRTMNDYSVTNRMAASGKSGCVVRLAGELLLPQGDYDLRLRIYEDGANRTLVSGLVRIIVEKDSVRVPDPYTPEGSSGRSGPPVAKADRGATTPGFEALGALGAAGLASVVITGRRRRTGV